MTYYRNRKDWIVFLAVQLSLKNHEGDLMTASAEEVNDAKRLLRRIGVQVPDEGV